MNRTVAKIREMPLYSAAEAARYLRLPASTVRAWSFGQGYRVQEGQRQFKAVISIADATGCGNARPVAGFRPM